MSNNLSTENKKSDITLSMKVNTHRYCDFDADRNCIFFFGADDAKTEKSIQWVSAYPLVSKSKSNEQPDQGNKINNNNNINDINNNNNNNNRRVPYINVFAKTGRFKTNEVKCKLVNVNVNVNVQISNHCKTACASHIGLSPLPLPLPPQHHIHYAQFPAYSHLSHPQIPQHQPQPQLAQIHPKPTTDPIHPKARHHHIMAHYEQKGQRLAQQRAEVEAEIARRTQCIEELETKLNDDTHETAVPYHYTQPSLQRPISGLSHLHSKSVGARPVVRVPQEYMVKTGNAYSIIGGHTHYVNMPATHSTVTVYVNGKTGAGSKRSQSHLPYHYHL